MQLTETEAATLQSPPLSTFYAGWARYQPGLRTMLATLTPEQLALPVGAHDWTLGQIAQHVIANRVWWFHVWMGEGGADVASIAHWDPADALPTPTLDAPQLVAGLDATWTMVSNVLDRWTAADLDRSFQPPAVMSAEEREFFGENSAQWIIWHVFEHEIHHGGELSLVLGSHGLPGIYGFF